MTLKEKMIKDLDSMGVNRKDYKLRYYKESPYQKARYKPEFVEQECWIRYHGSNNCVVASNWENKDFRNMILSELTT